MKKWGVGVMPVFIINFRIITRCLFVWPEWVCQSGVLGKTAQTDGPEPDIKTDSKPAEAKIFFTRSISGKRRMTGASKSLEKGSARGELRGSSPMSLFVPVSEKLSSLLSLVKLKLSA